MKLPTILTCMAASAAMADFSAYVDVSVNPGYTGQAVANFPVLVKIDSTKIPGIYSTVKNDGADLKFTDEDGVGEYPFEVDTWDDDGTSLVWVLLPEFSSSAKFRMYYGNADLTTPAIDPGAVWDGYDLVCHLSAGAVDSTTNHVAGLTNENGRVTAGKVGTAYGTTAGNVGAAMMNRLYPGLTAGLLPNGHFTVSFWLRHNATPVAWCTIVAPGLYNQTHWGISTANPPSSNLLITNDKTKNLSTNNSNAYTEGVWVKMDCVFDGNYITYYLNGVQSAKSGDLATAPKLHQTEWIGWGGLPSSNTPTWYTASCLAADFDECRVYGSVADAARVAADYYVVESDACVFGEPHGGEPDPVVLPNGIVVY